MTSVRLNHIVKKFGSTVALDQIDLNIAAGELFFLLGPSGCGKSTLLRLIAGLHEPTSGQIFFNDRDVTRLGTDKRNAVMCFQSYALWPHMTVRENVGFGLDVRKVPPEELDKRVDEVLAMVQMTAMADRKPNQLSGGQQQRVALARAMAVKPDCLLLDEPLSNLDAQLRLEMRTEIRRICKTAGFTTIYVTHDQKEALSVADRIAVLKDGKLMQVGSPGDLYHAPVSSFVAGFIGQTNLLPGKVVSRNNDTVQVETAAGVIAAKAAGTSDQVVVSIRPEQIRVSRGTPSATNGLTGKVIETTFLGEASEHTLAINNQKLKVICTPPLFSPPEELTVEFDPKDALALASEFVNRMRKYVIPILFGLILVTPFVLRVVLGAKTTAKPSPTATPLVVLTSHAEGIRREFGQAFQYWYKEKYGQDVYIDYIALATNEMSNLLKDRKHTVFENPNIRTYQIDVVWGGGDFYFDNVFAPYLKELKLDPALMKAVFPNPTLGGLPLYDQNPKHAVPHWYGAALSSFGFTYNKQVLKYLQLPDPKTWKDLEHPKYRNWLALGDPVASGSIKQAFMAIVEKSMADAAANHESEDLGWQRGMGEVRMICANVRTFSSGSNLIPGLISSGNAAAGMTIDMYGHAEVDAVPDGRLAYVQPIGATVVNPDPIAITEGVENDGPGREILAQRFVEFVLSRQGQLLWMKKAGTPGGPISTDLYRLPIMPSVYSDLTDSTVNENPFTASSGFNKTNAREKTFNILGELIQCSCIDCLSELQKTRFEILRSRKARELTNRLSVFPFDQKEALRRRAAYAVASPVDELALKRQWTDEFKAEYQKLRDEAKQ